jgi:hypothetical protein
MVIIIIIIIIIIIDVCMKNVHYGSFVFALLQSNIILSSILIWISFREGIKIWIN